MLTCVCQVCSASLEYEAGSPGPQACICEDLSVYCLMHHTDSDATFSHVHLMHALILHADSPHRQAQARALLHFSMLSSKPATPILGVSQQQERLAFCAFCNASRCHCHRHIFSKPCRSPVVHQCASACSLCCPALPALPAVLHVFAMAQTEAYLSQRRAMGQGNLNGRMAVTLS